MIIAAVRCEKEFEEALNSNVSIMFDLSPSILTLEEKVNKAHSKKKKLFIHLDLAEGIGKDKEGIKFAKKIGVDGIISTRVNIIKIAREENLFTVQRFFIVDSQSVNTTIEAVKSSKPSMIEIMPGILEKVVKKLKNEINIPIIAGGLIETKAEIKASLDAGASAVSTGKKEFWR